MFLLRFQEKALYPQVVRKDWGLELRGDDQIDIIRVEEKSCLDAAKELHLNTDDFQIIPVPVGY